MELIIAVLVVGVLVPLGVWLGDESNGRLGWRKVLDVHERFEVGEGAFRAATVEVSREEVVRERAPWWVRLLALTCYLPLSAAILSALPWLLGVVLAFERSSHHHGFEHYANVMLVFAYPVGAWAALRMAGLGAALLSGDPARFAASLRRVAMIQVVLNGALYFGAAALSMRFRHGEAMALFVAPTLTLAHLAVVSVVGRRQLGAAPQAPEHRAEDALSPSRASLPIE